MIIIYIYFTKQVKHNSRVHNIPIHLIPRLKCINAMQYGPKSTYIDETPVDPGPVDRIPKMLLHT